MGGQVGGRKKQWESREQLGYVHFGKCSEINLSRYHQNLAFVALCLESALKRPLAQSQHLRLCFTNAGAAGFRDTPGSEREGRQDAPSPSGSGQRPRASPLPPTHVPSAANSQSWEDPLRTCRLCRTTATGAAACAWRPGSGVAPSPRTGGARLGGRRSPVGPPLGATSQPALRGPARPQRKGVQAAICT